MINFLDLPNKLLELIFMHLPSANEIQSLALTCKYLRTAFKVESYDLVADEFMYGNGLLILGRLRYLKVMETQRGPNQPSLDTYARWAMEYGISEYLIYNVTVEGLSNRILNSSNTPALSSLTDIWTLDLSGCTEHTNFLFDPNKSIQQYKSKLRSLKKVIVKGCSLFYGNIWWLKKELKVPEVVHHHTEEITKELAIGTEAWKIIHSEYISDWSARENANVENLRQFESYVRDGEENYDPTLLY